MAGFACFLAVGLLAQAKDLTAYRSGDVAEGDITTPLPLDVPDPAATAALQRAKAGEFPPVFRFVREATNNLAAEFTAAFAGARSNFLVEIGKEFHSPVLDETTIASAGFGRLVTAFGVMHGDFPVPDTLAAEWARGNDAKTTCDQLAAMLQKVGSQRILPDEFPRGMVLGEAIRLVTVAAPEEKVSFESVRQSPLVPLTSVLTVSNAQSLIRRQFPAKAQLFARAFAAFVRPTCVLDEPYTRLTRGVAVTQVVVSDHYDAGDVLVGKGEVITPRSQAALCALDKALAANAVPTASQAGDVPGHTMSPTPVAMEAPAVVETEVPPKTGARHAGLFAGISLVCFVLAGAAYLKLRKKSRPPALQSPATLPYVKLGEPDLAPQVAQAVREAVQQELGMQRRELLLAQQAATAEIAALIHRLDELHAPLQERLQAYESRIQSLEKELALRNEENRELLKMKIEMIGRQMAAERAHLLVAPLVN